MKLLLISNSASPGESYLEKPLQDIKRFLGAVTDNIIFIPFAGVTVEYDAYTAKVNNALAAIGLKVTGIHTCSNPIEAVMKASAIFVGGGNTFMLTRMMQQMGLIQAIRERVLAGVPYIGWSAGSNVTCPTICTTNDMPIVEPESFRAFNLIPFQINPHYLDAHPDGHGGETREQRILEYIKANPHMYVAGLREGSRLWVEGEKIELLGERTMRLFKYGEEIKELSHEDDIRFLLAR